MNRLNWSGLTKKVTVLRYSYWLSLAPVRLAFVNPFTAGVYNVEVLAWSVRVSVLSPLRARRVSANGLGGENCRYDGDYEKTMGIHEKGHQGMVDRMV